VGLEGLIMVSIAIALQQRLIEAARRELGPGGDTLVRDLCQRALGCGIEQVTYAQLPELIAAVEREAPLRAGGAAAAAMAAELDRLRVHADADLGNRLVRALSQRLGPAADPCLVYVCGKLGLTLADLDRTQLPLIAAVIEKDGAALLGPEQARFVAGACEEARRTRPPGLALLLTEVAAEHGGPEGTSILQELARSRLGADLDQVDIEGISVLARAVEQDGPARIGAARTAAFVAAFRHAVVDPGDALRAQLLELTSAHIGPAASVFLRRICTRQGVPFEAVSFEHLMWLADALGAEVSPLVGQREADEFAAQVRALLPEPPAPVADVTAAPGTPSEEHAGDNAARRGVRDLARGWLRTQP
jgi:hypothetical protein